MPPEPRVSRSAVRPVHARLQQPVNDSVSVSVSTNDKQESFSRSKTCGANLAGEKSFAHRFVKHFSPPAGDVVVNRKKACLPMSEQGPRSFLLDVCII